MHVPKLQSRRGRALIAGAALLVGLASSTAATLRPDDGSGSAGAPVAPDPTGTTATTLGAPIDAGTTTSAAPAAVAPPAADEAEPEDHSQHAGGHEPVETPTTIALRPVVFPPPTPVVFDFDASSARFLSLCRHSHFGFDDPIVRPGQPGASHEHEFFGSVTTNAFSTVQSMVDGSTTCTASDDDSGYWFPALYEGGVRLEAVKLQVYYTSRVDDVHVQTIPEGFRMIAGSPTATTPQVGVGFNCGPGTADLPAPPDCRNSDFHVTLNFPECSNGQLDSADHKSHMAYRDRGTCPASHPILLPQLRAILTFVSNGGDDIAFASGPPVTFHGDFMNAWHPVTLQQVVDECLNSGRPCGEVQDA